MPHAMNLERTWKITPDILAVINAEGQLETTNPAWETILGWSKEEISYKPYLDFVHPEDINSSYVAFEAAKHGEPALYFQSRHLHKNGTYRWLSWVAVCEAGKLYCSARDITESKNQSEQLIASLRERERMWSLSQDLLVTANADGILLAINQAWMPLLGWEVNELIGHSFISFVHPEDLDNTIAIFSKIPEKPLTEPYEYRFRHKNGGYRWFSWTAAWGDGQIYATGRDTNAVHEQAAALAQSEASIRQLQKMEAVGQLTGGIAHDFNNILGAITGSLEMAKIRLMQGRNEDVERYANAAIGAAQRAASLTHRLLAFSRKQTLAPKNIGINSLVSDMEQLVTTTVGSQVQVKVKLASTLWSVLADESQLENSLLNLCINARDAMPHGGNLIIETTNCHFDQHNATEKNIAPGDYVCLSVSDSGTGMTPEVVARAFDPFFTTKPIGMGSGLGLSMVYGFARQSGGQVQIYSEVGGGTMVCIYLPKYNVVAEKCPQVEAEEHIINLKKQTVLVVEDESVLRMLITDVLKDLGYSTLEASDSKEGLKLLESEVQIDLLISDIGLPGGMNGREMVAKALNNRPELKVIFITGYAENAIFNQGNQPFKIQVMTKPFNMNSLIQRVQTTID